MDGLSELPKVGLGIDVTHSPDARSTLPGVTMDCMVEANCEAKNTIVVP